MAATADSSAAPACNSKLLDIIDDIGVRGAQIRALAEAIVETSSGTPEILANMVNDLGMHIEAAAKKAFACVREQGQ